MKPTATPYLVLENVLPLKSLMVASFLRDLTSHQKIILTGTKGSDRLYYLDTPMTECAHAATTTTRKFTKLELLHLRFGHLNYSAVKSLVRRKLVRGVHISKLELNAEPPTCESCKLGKSHHASFPPSLRGRATKPLNLVHTDLGLPVWEEIGI